MRWASLGLLVLAAVACRPAEIADTPASTPGPSPSPAAETHAPETAPTSGAAPANVPAGPGLVMRYRGDTDIELYAAYIVDSTGELGTRALWPHRNDCPQVEPPPHVIPAAGVGWLPPPTEAYEGSACTPTPLPAGDYIVRLHSGYGEDLYAAAAVTLPLTAPVELEMKVHDDPPPCDTTRARRAAVLAVAAAEAAGSLPPQFMRDCDLDQARCGTLPLDDAMPPPSCTVTLHETLLRIERPAGTDAIRSLDAWVDGEVVYAQRPDIDATSASRFVVEGQPVVIAGVTGHARHEHGGDASQLGHATFQADNPLAHDVALRATKVEFLTDHSCALPSEVRARPKVTGVSPASLPPGRSEIEVSFEAQSAYQAYCDRFAARVTFSVAGARAPVTVEYEVMRFEPLRKRD
jgi:hypothetical protein